MAEPAYFPAEYPAFPPEIVCYRKLFVSKGGPWQPVVEKPAYGAYRALPDHLNTYDAKLEYNELFRVRQFPYYWAGLWYLDRFGNWILHKQWDNWSQW